MSNIRNLLILLIFVISANAEMLKDIVYVEDENSSEISLKDEFFNNDTKSYTISIGTLKLDTQDPIDFFRKYKMTNALAYKFGENKKFVRVISGVYKTGTEAQLAIEKLDPELQRNKPYSAKLFRHQNLYKEDNSIVEKKINKNNEKKQVIKESKNSIYITENEGSKNLKKEFLNKNSQNYSIALGTVSLKKNSIKKFFSTYNVGDKALAHVYGKNKDKVRIIYGVYKSKKEATEALKSFDKKLKENKPFSMKMSKFQNFYKKSFPNNANENAIVELKVNDKTTQEKSLHTKLSDEIKIIKKEDKVVVKKIKKDILPEKKKKIEKKVIKPKITPKKIVKKKIKKTINKVQTKRNLNKNRFVKYSKLEDVYYIESDGNFNILSEVFLNDASSFYTIDLGELKLKDSSPEEFFVKNGMKDDALAYKYGDNNEFARIVYGAYETKNAAENAAKNINLNSKLHDTKVSNIKNHQKLYKKFHKVDKKVKDTTKFSKNDIIETDFGKDVMISLDEIVFIENEDHNNLLKKEFFNRESSFYTITLSTFLKRDIIPEEFFKIHELTNDALAYPIGSENNYYRVIYGLYNSYDDAKSAISTLDEQLRNNMPYVSRIRTNQRKFESYNNRNLDNEFNKAKKIGNNI